MGIVNHTGMAFGPPRLSDGVDILLVPGLNNSGPGHWQTIWEETLPGARRVDLGLWDDPHRNTWVNKLALAIGRSSRPVVLVGHSLGCHVIAWWAEYERGFRSHLREAGALAGPADGPGGGGPGGGGEVIGALLVAPPDVEEQPIDRRLTRFAPMPASELPFPATLVASRDDPYLSVGQARRLARRWGARFADAGPIGHINAHSGIGAWDFGLGLLQDLVPGWRASPQGAAPGLPEAAISALPLVSARP